MAALEDICKGFQPMVPHYVALMLGYVSVRWWRMFTAEQCDGINRMVCYFIIPLFGFKFTAEHAIIISSVRFKVKMPGIVKESIDILPKARSLTAMFNMGIFMAMQKKGMACGMKMTILGVVLRFVAGPALMTVSSLVVGLRGDVLRITIIHAAMPQSITTFIFAKEYGLHASFLNTAVAFGTLASLPLLMSTVLL